MGYLIVKYFTRKTNFDGFLRSLKKGFFCLHYRSNLFYYKEIIHLNLISSFQKVLKMHD